ncbi:hypothetical protein GGF46_005380 [Coemansia sp. RSA 552]|nr:hypothetical protein GGF46_005380 [Coemansia sp. RSA 552]
MATAIAAAKKQLRRQMQQVLAELTLSQLSLESSKVIEHVLALPAYTAAQHVSIYISMDRGELQTRPLIEHALGSGKTVYVPRCDGSSMDMVRLDGRQDLDNLPKNKWGIPEPSTDRAAVDPGILEFVLVPGVAFDTAGNRCGHGKGYYDRYLLRAPQAYSCAVCLSKQIVDAVPTDGNDQTPNTIISPTGTIFSRDQK